jgi:hypothetical protein
MTVRRLFEALFIIALFAMAVVETLDPDMWWHLRTGEYILANGLPYQDVFSFTVPDYAWITHEWLSQVFMWLVYSIGQFPALIIVFSGLIVLTYWLVYLVCDGRPDLAAFITLLAAIASAVVWGTRPQIFNMLFTAVFVFIIERAKQGKAPRWLLWTMPVVMIVWANAHSGYLLGVVVLGTYAIGEALQQWLGKDKERALSWQQIRDLAIITVLSFLVAALNPNGPALWIYPFETLGSPSMQQYIQEWQSPNFHAVMFWPFAVMVGVGVLAMILSPKTPTFSELLLFAGTTAAGFLSARHIPLFTIIALPVVAHHLTLVIANSPAAALVEIPDPHQTPKPSATFKILNWVILIVAVLGAVAWAGNKIANNEEAIARIYPVSAVDFIEENGLAEAKGYNSYNWGGYLIWRGLPVFTDGRADVYGDEFIFYYLQTMELQQDWQEPLDDYEIEYVIMETGSALNTLLKVSTEWEELYKDDVAQILVRVDR